MPIRVGVTVLRCFYNTDSFTIHPHWQARARARHCRPPIRQRYVVLPLLGNNAALIAHVEHIMHYIGHLQAIQFLSRRYAGT
jgi:hypothetical protein